MEDPLGPVECERRIYDRFGESLQKTRDGALVSYGGALRAL